MKKQETSGQKINGQFTAIPEILWEADFDIFEVNIIARILSWQRQGRKFFESEVSLAKMFGCARDTIRARIKSLLEKGIIVKGDKKGRVFEYKVNQSRLISYIERYKSSVYQVDNICIPGRHIEDESVYQVDNTCIPGRHYQNTYQSIDQNTQIEEQDAFCERLAPTQEELEAFAQELDI